MNELENAPVNAAESVTPDTAAKAAEVANPSENENTEVTATTAEALPEDPAVENEAEESDDTDA